VPLTALVLVLLGLAVVTIVLTRVRVRRADGPAVGPLVLGLHTGAGLVGVALFALYVLGKGPLGDSRALVGILGLAGLWVATACGLVMMARWLPSRGRHAPPRAAGASLSVLAHVGMLVAVGVMTVAYMFDSV